MLATHFNLWGKAFHSLGAATENAASPALPRILGTTRALLLDERRQRVVDMKAAGHIGRLEHGDALSCR